MLTRRRTLGELFLLPSVSWFCDCVSFVIAYDCVLRSVWDIVCNMRAGDTLDKPERRFRLVRDNDVSHLSSLPPRTAGDDALSSVGAIDGTLII